MASTALINGVDISWGYLNVVFYGNIMIGITKLNYKAVQKKENRYGWGYKPISRGYGNYEYEGSIEMYTDEWKKIIAAAPNNDPLQILPTDMQIVYAGQRVLPSKDVIQAFEWLENPFDANQGDTALMVTVPIIIGDIVRTA
jgi:hypothetical protein